MMINRLFAPVMLVIAALSVMTMSVAADNLNPPQALVKQATDRVLKELRENKQALSQDQSKVYALVDEVLMPHFDFERMSRLALGQNWRQATKEQQKQFVEEFKMLLVRTYSTAMLEYTDEKLRLLPFRDDLSKKRVSVPMEVVRSGGPPVPVSLALYLNGNDEWKVYDVKIEGISLVTNYRSTFANQIRNGGMEQLLKDLADRNAKLRS